MTHEKRQSADGSPSAIGGTPDPATMPGSNVSPTVTPQYTTASRTLPRQEVAGASSSQLGTARALEHEDKIQRYRVAKEEAEANTQRINAGMAINDAIYGLRLNKSVVDRIKVELIRMHPWLNDMGEYQVVDAYLQYVFEGRPGNWWSAKYPSESSRQEFSGLEVSAQKAEAKYMPLFDELDDMFRVAVYNANPAEEVGNILTFAQEHPSIIDEYKKGKEEEYFIDLSKFDLLGAIREYLILKGDIRNPADFYRRFGGVITGEDKDTDIQTYSQILDSLHRRIVDAMRPPAEAATIAEIPKKPGILRRFFNLFRRKPPVANVVPQQAIAASAGPASYAGEGTSSAQFSRASQPTNAATREEPIFVHPYLADIEPDWAHMPLFSHEPSLEDIIQGSIHDCYLMSALINIVRNNPELLKTIMMDNNDGTVNVIFYKTNDNGIKLPVSVTVDKRKDSNELSRGALWVWVMEKAYYKFQQQENLSDKRKPNTLRGQLDYHPMGEALNRLTSTKVINDTSLGMRFDDNELEQVIRLSLDNKLPLIAGFSRFTFGRFRSWHAYAITDLEEKGKTYITLTDPYGKKGFFTNLIFPYQVRMKLSDFNSKASREVYFSTQVFRHDNSGILDNARGNYLEVPVEQQASAFNLGTGEVSSSSSSGPHVLDADDFVDLDAGGASTSAAAASLQEAAASSQVYSPLASNRWETSDFAEAKPVTVTVADVIRSLVGENQTLDAAETYSQSSIKSHAKELLESLHNILIQNQSELIEIEKEISGTDRYQMFEMWLMVLSSRGDLSGLKESSDTNRRDFIKFLTVIREKWKTYEKVIEENKYKRVANAKRIISKYRRSGKI